MDDEDYIEKMIAEIPDALLPKIKLSEVNEPIPLYIGKFYLILKERVIQVDGEIYFSWKPEAGITFNASSPSAIFLSNEHIEEILIPGLDLEHGQVRIHSLSNEQIKGIISSPFIIKYVNEPVDCIYFELANFKNTFGENTKINRAFTNSRMQWVDKDWQITIDKLPDFDKVYNQLKSEGGYALTHTGKITPISGSITHEEGKTICEKLGLFLSFIKGRRAYPYFLQGFRNDKLCWIDYSAFYVDRHKDVDSWLPQFDYSGIPELWEGFLKLTLNEDDYQCVDYLLHWYFEANNNSGFVEGSIVLLQNAFELLYNWRVKAKKDTKINADVKIRELLKQAHLPLEFYQDYEEMLQELKLKKIQFNDFPKLFTLIRNAIVHSNRSKRNQLSNYSGTHRFYIKHIGLYYMELLLLHLFGYKGKTANRLPLVRYAGANEELVPWISIGQNK